MLQSTMSYCRDYSTSFYCHFKWNLGSGHDASDECGKWDDASGVLGLVGLDDHVAYDQGNINSLGVEDGIDDIRHVIG